MNEIPLIKRFLQHESEFIAYLMAITRDLNASEEVFQNAAVVVMEHAARGEEVHDFRAWAKEIVRRQALHYLREESKSTRRSRPIEPVLLDAVTRVFMDNALDESQRQRETLALRHCIQEVVQPSQRKMLAMRYERKASFKEIGQLVNKTEAAVQRALSRVRKRLHDCVQAKLA